MPSPEEIVAYIRQHPLASDRSISKHFDIPRKRVTAFRAAPSLRSTPSWQRSLDSFFQGYQPMLFLFCLALAVRIVAFFFFRVHPETTVPILDAAYYIIWAKEILAEGIIGTRPFFTEPLYAYLLAFFFKISSHGENIMIGLQILTGTLLPIIIMNIGKIVFDKKTGFLAGIFTALYAPFLFYEHVLLKTAFENLLIATFILILFLTLQKNIGKRYAIAGAVLGILTLIKGNGLIFIPVTLLAILFNPTAATTSLKQKLSWAAWFIFGFFIILSPIILRNLVVSHSFMLTNYSLGMNFYQGNFWGSDGALLQPSFIRPDPKFEEIDSSKMAEAYSGGHLTPNQISRFWIGKTIEEMYGHPKDWIMLTWNKFLLIINQHELGDNYVYDFTTERIPFLRFLPNFWLLIPFGLAGLLFSFFFPWHPNEKKVRHFFLVILITFIMSYAFTIMLFHANARYRLPILPLILIFSAISIRFLFSKLLATEAASVIFSSVLCLGMFAATNIQLRNFDVISAADPYNNLGIEAIDRHDLSVAQKFFETAREKDPNNLISWRNLFLLSLRSGDRNEAKRCLLQELKIRPDDGGIYQDLALFRKTEHLSDEETVRSIDEQLNKNASTGEADRYDPDFYEGWKLFKEKRYEEAERYLLLSSAKFDNPEESLLLLALAKKNIIMADQSSQNQPSAQAKISEVENLLRSIIEKNNSFLPATYQLSLLYAQEKKYAESEKLFKDIHALTDDYLDTWYYYGLSASYAKDFTIALPLMRSFVDRYRDDASRHTQVEKFRSLLETSVRK